MAIITLTLKNHNYLSDPITTLGIDSVLHLFIIDGFSKECVDLMSSKKLSEPRLHDAQDGW